MVPSVRRCPHECSSSQFPAWAAQGKGTTVPLLAEPKLLALGNPPKSPKQGGLRGVGRTIAFKRFRSALLYTFLPSPWQQARRWGIWLLGNCYSCKDNSKLWLQISLFPREETKYSSRKKACLGTGEKSGNCSPIGVFLLSLFPSSQPLPSGCQLRLLLWQSICQASRCLCGHRCSSLHNGTGVLLGYKDLCGHGELNESMPDPQRSYPCFPKMHCLDQAPVLKVSSYSWCSPSPSPQ